VLGLLDEGPAHGFALARLLDRGGEVARVWSATRPLTYRSLDQLVADGAAAPLRTETGPGPQRVVHAVTPAGRKAIRGWLNAPVHHIRDVRAELLVKLLLLERADRSPDELLARQREAFRPLLAEVRSHDGTDVVTRWRVAQAEAVASFLRL
jgi:PadR family transcriptional regulator AphA